MSASIRVPFLLAIPLLYMVSGCGSDHPLSRSSTSSPATLNAATSKFDKTYEETLGAVLPKLAQSEQTVVAAATNGDRAGVATIAARDQALYQEALAADNNATTQMSKETTVDIPIPDHPNYVAYYTAVTGKLTARREEYKAILAFVNGTGGDPKAVADAAMNVSAMDKKYETLKQKLGRA